MIMRARRCLFLALLSLVLVTGPHASARAEESFRVTGEVKVVCALTVGGSFEARTKALTGDLADDPDRPGHARGTVRVDLDSLRTGIGLRDRHMRNNYLEVDKGPDYAVAVAENLRLERPDGKGAFTGTLTLHGQRQEIAGTAEVQRRDGRIRIVAEFPLRVSSFQIPSPTYLGVGVRDEVRVTIDLVGAAATGTR